MRGIDMPWMIYHIPGRTAVSVTVDTVKELKDKSPNFVGMKHAVNDLDFVTECLTAVGRDFRIFVGLEDLSFPMMTVGACGLMNAVGNLRPRVLAEMCEAVWRGDLEDRAGIALPPARPEQGGLLRDQSDADEIHGQAPRHHRRQRAPPAHGAGDIRIWKSGSMACCAMPACFPRARRPNEACELRDRAGTSFGAVVDGGVVDLARRTKFDSLFDVLRAGALGDLSTKAAKADLPLDAITYCCRRC